MRILAIETSCDETAIAILEKNSNSLSLKKNLVYSQVEIHTKYGGVIPEVAARKHVETLIPLLDKAISPREIKKIDYLAVTAGPGLVTSLLLGVTLAKTLAYASYKPLLPINHIEGHIYSNWLSNQELAKDEKKYLPALVLIVSGGHTELVLMKGHGQYQLLGQTLDDAVGEAYDKVAKLLDLGYPGGPIVSRLAEQGDVTAYDFPRPMIDKNNFDFSLSGLKTAVRYTLEKKQKITKNDMPDICASFQQAVVDVLLAKTIKAAKKHQVKSIMLAGGVSANGHLKKSLNQAAKENNFEFFYPKLEYTGDNAAMIAVAAAYSNKKIALKGKKIFDLEPKSNWQLFSK